MTASGASAEESLDPTSASFGELVGATSPPQAFTLTVDCFDTASVSCSTYSFSPNIFVRGLDPNHFAQTNNCPPTMQVEPFEEESCTINVTFRPLSAGPKEAILFTGSGGPAAELTGYGVPPPDDGTPPPDGAAPPDGTPLTLDLEAKKQKLRKKLKFFATATVASTLVAEGKKIKETTKQLAANQKTKVKTKLKPKAKKKLVNKLDKKGKAKVKVTGTATTQSGADATDKVKVKLTD